MFSSTIKKLVLAATVVSALSLTACLQGEDKAAEGVTYLKVSTMVDGVNAGSLSKGSLISYKHLVIVLTSNSTSPTATDTLRDTIHPGEQGFTATSTSNQTIDSVYVVKGLRTWKITANVYDTKDSLTHTGFVTPSSFVKVADTLIVPTLTLTSRFTMYEAKFTGLPDSVTTSATTHKQQVKFRRLVLKVNGVIRGDTTIPGFPGASFTGGLNSFTWDYVAVGSPATIRMIAYGTIGTGYNDSLFVGQTTLTGIAGADSTVPLTLTWTNPAGNLGSEKTTVTIGKIGKTTVNGGTSGTGVVPKNKQ